MTVNDYLAAIFGDIDARAAYEAKRQYEEAVDRHFAAAQRMDAHYELVVSR